MPSSPKFVTDRLQLLQHPLAHRFPNHRKLPVSGHPTTVRESKKVERLRFPRATSLPVLHREPSELDQPRLLGVQSQSERRQSLAEFVQKLFSFLAMLEPHHEVICETHDYDIAMCLPISPTLGPEIEYVM